MDNRVRHDRTKKEMHAAMTPKAEMRVLVGLVIQPFVAFAVGSVAFPAMTYVRGMLDPDRGSQGVAYGGAGAAALGAAMAAPFVVIFGALPAIAWLSRRGPLTLGKSLISGALLGNLPMVVILLLAALNGNLRASESGSVLGVQEVTTAAFGAFVGMICALVFWVFAREPAEPRTSSLGPRPTA